MSTEFKRCPNGHYYQGDSCPYCKSTTSTNSTTNDSMGNGPTQKTQVFNGGFGGGTVPNDTIPDGGMGGGRTQVAGQGGGSVGSNKTTVVDNGTAASRAEMIVALWKAVGSPAVTAALSKFTDLEGATADELAAYQWAVANGVIVGTTETTISPAGSATRAQFATMLMRAVKAQVL